MIFTKNAQFDDQKVHLVKNLLEKLIGKPKDYCQNKVKTFGFEFLDNWDDKVGFVKEDDKEELILSLQFREDGCYFYQLIIKNSNESWIESRILDYNRVRRNGIININNGNITS
jgi:hypothetical protein